MSDASRLIDRLVKKGYLDKFPSDFDRRSNRVRISDSGLEILKEINSRKEGLDGIVNDLLSDKEIKELNRLLSLLK
jgi:DNA-binding MarR family transcriptional regulator